MSRTALSRHERHSEALASPRHCARLYARSGAAPVTFSANPEDAAAAAGREETGEDRVVVGLERAAARVVHVVRTGAGDVVPKVVRIGCRGEEQEY